MVFVKLTRGDTSSLIAGPYEDPVDAGYQRKQLAAADPDPSSVYELVDASWVITIQRQDPESKPEVISWYETEEQAKKDAAITQRADHSVIVDWAKWPLA